jgi:hypothetical protein
LRVGKTTIGDHGRPDAGAFYRHGAASSAAAAIDHTQSRPIRPQAPKTDDPFIFLSLPRLGRNPDRDWGQDMSPICSDCRFPSGEIFLRR